MLRLKKSEKDRPYLLRSSTAAPSELPKAGVYVLDVEGGGIYVGKSKDIENRLKQHREGRGNSFAQLWVRRIAAATPRMDDWESWERAETLHWMRERGPEHVRGWMYTNLALNEDDLKSVQGQLCERYDLCRKCFGKGHFWKACKKRWKARQA